MGTSGLDGSGRARSGSDRARPQAATHPALIEPNDDVRVLHRVAWPGLTRPLDEVVAAPSGLWIVEHRPWQDIAVARGRVITTDADVTVDVQHLDQVRVRVARDLGLTPVEAHALVVVPEEVPALRLEGVVIVGQRLVRQIILSPGRRLTPTQLDVLARRTAKVLGHAAPAPPQALPETTGTGVAPDAAGRSASAFNRVPSARSAPSQPVDQPRDSRPTPLPPTVPVPELSEASHAARETDAAAAQAPAPEPDPSVPTVPVRATKPELLPSTPAPTEHHDEPPPPLPTPEEMGLPPALLEPSAQHHGASVDPIWPIAPPPGLRPAPEPEPELAQLVADIDTDQPEPDDGESDLERTRVVEASSTVPEVDDEPETDQTRIGSSADQEHLASDRGLPRLVEPATERAWPEKTWFDPLDPTTAGRLTDLDHEPDEVGPFGRRPFDLGLDYEPADPRPTDAEPADRGLFGRKPFDLGHVDHVDPQPTDPEPADHPLFDRNISDRNLGHLDSGPVSHEPVDPHPADRDLFDRKPSDLGHLDDHVDPQPADHNLFDRKPSGLGHVNPQPADRDLFDRKPFDLGHVDDLGHGHKPADRSVVDRSPSDLGHVAPEPVAHEPVDTAPSDAEPVGPAPAEPEPIDREMLTELVEAGLVGPDLLADLIAARLIDRNLMPDQVEPDDRVGAPGGTELGDLPTVGSLLPDRTDDHPSPSGLLDVRGGEAPASHDEPDQVEVYEPLDDDVELTRIRPPDRPAASQSLAEARRAFFSGAGDDPVTAFPQVPDEDTTDKVPGSAERRGRHPAPSSRPAARLPVAWDDDPLPPSDGSRPQVAWDPPQEPRRGERPTVAWDDPAPGAAPPEPEAQRPERRSVVAGPRPPADHRPVEHTERPDQPAERPARYRSGMQTTRPAAARESVPSPAPGDRRGGPAQPTQPAQPVRPTARRHPPRPHAERTGPWNLSPAQAAVVEGRFAGPVRLRGAFGTGRSVAVAYRAVHLAQTRPGPVAIVVPAAAQIEPMHRRLAAVAEAEVLERIVVDVPAGIARTLLAEFGTEVNLAPESVARAWSVAQRSTGLGAAQGRSIGLLLDEVALIRGRGLDDESRYEQLRQEMPSGLRHQVWVLHEAYLAELRQRNLPDEHDLVRMARAALRAGMPSELSAVVVDDANDLTLNQLTMLREAVGTGTDALTLVDDGLPGLLPVGATLSEAGIDVAQRQVDLAHEFRLTGPAWTSLIRLLQSDAGRDIVGATDRPRLAGRLDDGEGPAYLRSQAIRLRRDRLVERVAELVGEGVPPESIALLHIEDEPEPELVAELVRAGVMVRGLDALDVPAVALGRARDSRGVEFDHVLVPDARHRDVVPVGGLRWDQRQRRRLIGLALSRSRETAWIAGV